MSQMSDEWFSLLSFIHVFDPGNGFRAVGVRIGPVSLSFTNCWCEPHFERGIVSIGPVDIIIRNPFEWFARPAQRRRVVRPHDLLAALRLAIAADLDVMANWFREVEENVMSRRNGDFHE